MTAFTHGTGKKAQTRADIASGRLDYAWQPARKTFLLAHLCPLWIKLVQSPHYSLIPTLHSLTYDHRYQTSHLLHDARRAHPSPQQTGAARYLARLLLWRQDRRAARQAT